MNSNPYQKNFRLSENWNWGFVEYPNKSLTVQVLRQLNKVLVDFYRKSVSLD